ncbi:MAG: tetratricopeptide repeat protein [Candidatus Algichlamydia australiensis]|nr:tetratricopeptide repeat protein [Chlamydiales bacterium]
MRNFLLFFVMLWAVLFSAEPHLGNASYEERLLARRIAEFYKDGDFDLVKLQIQDFFKEHPNSPLKDNLYGLLGDLFLSEEKYEKALVNYNEIQNPKILEMTLLNKLQCYYELSDYKNIIKEATLLISKNPKVLGERENELYFLMAESLYREALQERDEGQAKQLASMAAGYYEKLSDHSFGEVPLFALADIYTLLGNNIKAAKLYLELASDYPAMREELYFRAAGAVAANDPLEAIDLYEQVIEMEGKFAKESSFNQLVLYFQQENYQKVLDAYPVIETTIPKDQVATFDYILAKSYFSLGQFDEAISPAESFLSHADQASLQVKNSLLILMTCAQKKEDLSLFQNALTRFEKEFAGDPELGKAHFMHAMLLKDQGNEKEVLTILSELLNEKSCSSERESLLFEHGYLSHKLGQYEESRQSLRRFLIEFAGTEREKSAWKLFLASSLELQRGEGAYTKELFYDDLVRALSQKDLFDQSEIAEYELLLGKIAYDLNRFAQTEGLLKSYLEKITDPMQQSEAHFLLALCYDKIQGETAQCCSHFETVLSLDPEFREKSLVHLHLYNSYLEMKNQVGNEGQAKELTEKAANHLFAAIETGDHEVKRENQLWLADHYFEKARPYLDNLALLSGEEKSDLSAIVEKALPLYERALTKNNRLISFDEKSLYLEAQALKYAELMGVQNEHNKKIALLTHLVEQQDNHPNWSWDYQKKALFELAKSYEEKSELEKALETYSFIARREGAVSSPLINIAAYHSAKLRFALLHHSQKNEHNPEVHEILTQLKELQIRKNSASEPIHLEAALEYATVRANLTPKERRDERYLFFLGRMVEDFNEKEDMLAQSYHEELAKSEEKGALFTAYMKFVEAERLRIAARKKQKENKLLEAEELSEQALALLFEIESNDLVKEYLHQRVIQSIEAINEAESYS